MIQTWFLTLCLLCAQVPCFVLSNNAGVFMKQFVASDEGIEYMFAAHNLGTTQNTLSCLFMMVNLTIE